MGWRIDLSPAHVIRIFVLGLPYWASQIARALDASAPDVHATFAPWRAYPGLLVPHRRAHRVVLMRVGYRPGSSTPRGRIFDAYWSALRHAVPEAVGCHYWLGTDVLETLTEARAGTLRLTTLASTRRDLHLANGPWLTTELGSVGIEATLAMLPIPRSTPRIVPPMPLKFSVLTYLPSARFEFYRGDAVLEAARRLPEVQFEVVGSDGEPGRSVPANVRWHGWVQDMSPYYAAASVIVRIPEHDGIGNTVVEGLLNGRHVIYTQDMPFVRRLAPPTAEALTRELAALQQDHVVGRLDLNRDGRDYALETFDERKLAERFVALLRTAT